MLNWLLTLNHLSLLSGNAIGHGFDKGNLCPDKMQKSPNVICFDSG